MLRQVTSKKTIIARIAEELESYERAMEIYKKTGLENFKNIAKDNLKEAEAYKNRLKELK